MLKLLLMTLLFSTYIYAEEIKIDTKAITKAHNDLRAKYKSPPLKYSQSLEQAARQWAEKLQKDGCGMVHSHGKVGKTGENLYWASPRIMTRIDSNGHKTKSRSLQNVKDQAVVQAWYDEVQWYDYDTNSCEAGQMCGHYTQVIWNTTSEVGCAAMACDDKSQVWVCEYTTPGNVSMRYADGKVEKLKPY